MSCAGPAASPQLPAAAPVGADVNLYAFLRPLLFCLDAETGHNLALAVLRRLGNARLTGGLLRRGLQQPLFEQPVEVMGVQFKNPVGLAAGLDKQGNCANIFSALGFGWVELGTVTPLPQAGSPRPRIFRLRAQQAMINRMGFNSVGLQAFLSHLRSVRSGVIKGINIGKNAATPLERAKQDYHLCLDAVYAQADYVAINVSSPNTGGLRELQQAAPLDDLLHSLNHRRQRLADQSGRYVPLVLKIAPDLEAAALRTIAELSRRHRIEAIAATNTTLLRAGVESHPLAAEAGGLSGPPLAEKSTRTIRLLHGYLQGEVALIGVGGIDSAQAANDKFDAGASLVQLYTGLVYQGPGLIKAILRDRADRRPPAGAAA